MSATGRNDPCPCGSGKKHKHCCLRQGRTGQSQSSNPVLEQVWGHYHAKQLSQAEKLCRQALLQSPRDPGLLHALGVLALRSGRAANAVDLIRQAIAIDDSVASCFLDLGRGYSALQRFDEADAVFQRAVSMARADPDIHFGAGMACALAGRFEIAARHFENCLRLNPGSARACYNLGLTHMKQGRIDDAAVCYQRALEIDPADFNARLNLGIAFVRQGMIDEAISCFRQALRLKPQDKRAHYNLGLALLYADAAPEELFSWHQEVSSTLETPDREPSLDFDNVPEPDRKLKIGYVSPDFRKHSVANFIEPVIANHDRSQFEVYCYFNHAKHDEVSERLERLADYWRPCHDLSDDQLAAQIRSDEIDILVDLAGHMKGNRLPVFARKIAPVQVSYLGYPATTGLKSMDFRLVTNTTDPPGEERWHSEQLYRLPRTLWCYRPPPAAHEVERTPPLVRNNFATFGSMNNIAKLSSRTIDVWAEILRRNSTARLVLTGIPERAGRTALLERFEAHGIDTRRITIHDRLPSEEYWKLLNGIDIALDPFPYNGTTTTCETLWTGIPLVNLIGNSSVSRAGYALLKVVGLEQLATPDETAYIETALRLASDPKLLTELRSDLRQRMEDSPLRDERGFTQDLEAAFRDMWKDWCSSNDAEPGTANEPGIPGVGAAG